MCTRGASWAIVTHCEIPKFELESILPPGHRLWSILEKDLPRGRFVPVNSGSTVDWRSFPSEQAVFLVDSPFYNPYVDYVVKHYQTHLAGGKISFPDSGGAPPPKQHIEVRGKAFTSSKDASHKRLLDTFEDYLLIMRLPGLVTVRDGELEMVAIDKTRTIWVVAGIHSKASYAGAQLLLAQTSRN